MACFRHQISLTEFDYSETLKLIIDDTWGYWDMLILGNKGLRGPCVNDCRAFLSTYINIHHFTRIASTQTSSGTI